MQLNKLERFVFHIKVLVFKIIEIWFNLFEASLQTNLRGLNSKLEMET